MWGFTELLPNQRQAIDTVLAGRDSLVVLPTGGGKSLCYQAPALAGDQLAVVVSPLIALMNDQVSALEANGAAAACLHSAMADEERRRVVRDLRQGRLRLLYVSPERLVGDGGDGFRSLLAECRPRFVAVDEAHCISHWGHEFRPEYRQLGSLRRALPGISLHAFTATATEQVRTDIAAQLGLVEPVVIVGSFDRPNLVYRVLRRDTLRAQVEQVHARHPGQAGIVYCITRREVEQLAEHLRRRGHRAVPYHAGLDDVVRRANQTAFANEQADIVVATVAFGMGIDRSNVRFVVHAGAPRSLEHYQQEAGRAGRDGLEAECVLIWSGADLMSWKRILELSGEVSDGARRHLAEIAAYASRVACRHRLLVEHFGQRLPGGGCGACDVCLGELEPVAEATLVAQKVLSCVVRVEERWGVGHVVDVLRGRATERVVANRHDQLSTFGLLADCPVAELRGHLEQLVDQGLLVRSGGDYPTLAVAPAGWELLRGRRDVELVRHRRAAKAASKGRSAVATRAEAASWEGVDHGLFELLRQLRLAIAGERGVPPFVVFHDATLRDLARRRPTATTGLAPIYGLGAKKIADYGARLVDAVAAYCRGAGLATDL